MIPCYTEPVAEFRRAANLGAWIQVSSLFLVGPRQTGKTTLLRQAFPKAKYYNLLQATVVREVSRRPEMIRQRRRPGENVIIIDEIQRLPALLDEVQLMIDSDRNLRFILTGSSLRSLRRGGVNLLGGRAAEARLHPLMSCEIGPERFLERLNLGSLPFVLNSASPQQMLEQYVGIYLREEVIAEGAIRQVEPFSRFLNVAALANGEQINYTKMGADCQVSPRTIREYVQILDDTLVARELPAFTGTKARKPVTSAKLYLFDVGVANILMGRGRVEPGTEGFGRALEHQIFLELRAFLDYTLQPLPLTYWRSTSQFEVDFLLDGRIAIESKGKEYVTKRDYKGLLALAEEIPLERKIIVCAESEWRMSDEGVEVMPMEEFFRELWKGSILPIPENSRPYMNPELFPALPLDVTGTSHAQTHSAPVHPRSVG
ncbi:MAG: ATP-binding protein [Acidobacteria bacterium]|nr:ATP-binding protein [Acidobacteriota bacterium]